jgi:hypothetical protein
MLRAFSLLGLRPNPTTAAQRQLEEKSMVARDGIEPPTPAFSGLRSTI